MSNAAASSSTSKKSKKSSTAASAAPVVVPTQPAASSSSDGSSDEEQAGPSRSRDEDSDESSDIDEDMPDVADLVDRDSADQRGKGKRKYPAFRPPHGMNELKVPVEFASSPFEWDQMSKKEGVELWAIRLPMNFKPSRMKDLQLHIPPATTTNPHPFPRGTLTTSKHRYTIAPAARTSLLPSELPSNHGAMPMLADTMAASTDPAAIGSGARAPNEGAGEERERKEELVDDLTRNGGEEMGGLRLVVPRMAKGGDLYMAPKPVSRHLILLPSEDAAEPASDGMNLADLTDIDPSDPCLRPLPIFTSSGPISSQPTSGASLVVPPRGEGKRPQPLDKLKYRNVPFGSGLTKSSSERAVDRDGDVSMITTATEQESPKKKKHKKDHGSKQESGETSKRKEKKVKA